MARESIDGVLAKHKADAFIAPSLTPTFLTDIIMGDGRVVAPTIPCVTAGYPHLSVPAGYVRGLPRYAPWAARLAPVVNVASAAFKGALGLAPQRT